MSSQSRYDKLVEGAEGYLRIGCRQTDDLLHAQTLATLALADAVHRLALSRGAF